MAGVTYAEVIRLVEQLTPVEQEALRDHLWKLAQQRQLTIEERRALFASLSADLGPILPDFSDRRQDWYGDDER